MVKIMIGDKRKSESGQAEKNCDAQRREFLRKSLYTAYATPVIMSLLVEKASAQFSSDVKIRQCKEAGGVWIGPGSNGCCDYDRDGKCP